MAVELKTKEETAVLMEKATVLAEQITKDSSLAAGLTEEQWERSPVIADVYEMLIYRGSSEAEAEANVNAASWEEIQRRHREMYPAQHPLK